MRALKLKNPDKALRLILMLFAEDPNYQRIGMAAIPGVWRSVWQGNYLLFEEGGDVVAAVTWGGISAQTRDACLAERREPTADEILARGAAVFALSLGARSAQWMLPAWRTFLGTCGDADVLALRHFRSPGRGAMRFMHFRQGRLVEALDIPSTTAAAAAP